MSDKLLSIRAATEIASNRLNVSTDEAQIRLIEAIAKGKIRGIINPKYEQQLADALAPTITNADDPLAALRESTTRGAMVHSLLIQYGMVSQDELLIWLNLTAGPKSLRVAEPRPATPNNSKFAEPCRNLPKLCQLNLPLFFIGKFARSVISCGCS